MSASVEVIRNDGPIWFEGTICDGTRGVIHFVQSSESGESYYLIDLSATCQCGKSYRGHEILGIAVGTVE